MLGWVAPIKVIEMNNSDNAAFPTQVNGGDLFGGLTKREAFVMAAMQGLCANSYLAATPPEQISRYSVKIADATLAELEK